MVEWGGHRAGSKGVREAEPLPHSQNAGSRPQSERAAGRPGRGPGLVPAPDPTLIQAVLTLRRLSLPED